MRANVVTQYYWKEKGIAQCLPTRSTMLTVLWRTLLRAVWAR